MAAMAEFASAAETLQVNPVAANKWLMDFERSPHVWGVLRATLAAASASETVRWLAANMVANKLRHDTELSPDEKQALRGELLAHFAAAPAAADPRNLLALQLRLGLCRIATSGGTAGVVALVHAAVEGLGDGVPLLLLLEVTIFTRPAVSLRLDFCLPAFPRTSTSSGSSTAQKIPVPDGAVVGAGVAGGVGRAHRSCPHRRRRWRGSGGRRCRRRRPAAAAAAAAAAGGLSGGWPTHGGANAGARPGTRVRACVCVSPEPARLPGAGRGGGVCDPVRCRPAWQQHAMAKLIIIGGGRVCTRVAVAV
jgi:hypothetical protein